MKKFAWKVGAVVGAVVEVFEDVMTQHNLEGIAKIIKIHKKNAEVVDCDVRFYKDIFINKGKFQFNSLEDEVVRRQIKR